MNTLRQIFAVCGISFGSVPQRLSTSIVIVAGTACVVAVLLSTLSISTGLIRAAQTGGSPSRAVILPKGIRGGGSNLLERDAVGTILNAPGIAETADGKPLADAEWQLRLLPPEGVVQGLLSLVAIGPTGPALRPDFKIESGRMFRTGAQEVIVGLAAAKRFGYAPGGKIVMPDGQWPIVGMFSSGGDFIEGRFLADADTVLAASRASGFGSMLVQLKSVDAYDAFAAWLNANPALRVDVIRQTDFNARQVGSIVQLFERISYLVGIVMALGALFGTVKIMYAAVRARTREIGTLRALGFGGAAVATSVLVESTALSLTGAAIGAFLAWLIFDGRQILSWDVYPLHVSLQLVALGLAWGGVIALLGGVLPALRAARLPVIEALRAA